MVGPAYEPLNSRLPAAGVAFTPLGAWRPFAVVGGLPFVLLVPGYAIVSAVFPRAGEAAPNAEQTSWTARLGLSVAASCIAIALVGGVLDFTVWGFERTAVVVGLSVVTLGATAIAWFLLRASGTEPRIRVTAEAREPERADAVYRVTENRPGRDHSHRRVEGDQDQR